MKISSLGLVNFRSHELLQLEFAEGATSIIGRNGLGKTNIVEAVHYSATLASHRVAQDGPLIRNECDSSFINTVAQKNGRQANVAITINRDKQNVVELNGAPVRRPRDVVGVIQVVIFSPEDLDLVKNEPAVRRRFLDEFLTLQSPRMAEVKQDYERALKQRNSLLKSAGRRALSDTARSTLVAWDEQLVKFGAELVLDRLKAIEQLLPHITEFGNVISGTTEPIGVTYHSSWLTEQTQDRENIAEQLRLALENRHKEEVDRGLTLFGPHRDDLSLELAGMPVRNYASHGQSWSVAIALRMSTFAVLREHDSDPVLILDDVFAELDARRRGRLIETISGVEQTIITVADEADVPKEFDSVRYWLADGVAHAN
jgi:DNA replication and repair protein RecF